MWQTGLGGHGPCYTYKSYGILVQHMSGVSLMTGSPGAPPAVVNSSYSDYHTGVFQRAAIIGALLRRRRNGPRQVGANLDYQVNRRLPERRENRDAVKGPHGVNPCRGENRYCAIAVFTDQEWRAFCRMLGRPRLQPGSPVRHGPGPTAQRG